MSQLAPTVETKSIKHTFSPPEREQIGTDLARSVGSLRGIEAEFDNVKAGYKAKTTEAQAKIESLSTTLTNGFEFRNQRCVVIFRTKDRKKDYHLESDFNANNGNSAVVLTEDMTVQDFEQDLIQAESKFDQREEITLFTPTEHDHGTLVIGRFADKWFGALRIKIGKFELNERLDSEQPCFKERSDAVKRTIQRAREWMKDNLKEHAKGFEKEFDGVIEAHKERVE